MAAWAISEHHAGHPSSSAMKLPITDAGIVLPGDQGAGARGPGSSMSICRTPRTATCVNGGGQNGDSQFRRHQVDHRRDLGRLLTELGREARVEAAVK